MGHDPPTDGGAGGGDFEGGFFESGRAQGRAGVVGKAVALARDAKKRIEFVVVVFVVVGGDGVTAGAEARKHGALDLVPVELRSATESGGSVLHARAEVILGTQFSAQEPELGDVKLAAYSGSQEEIYDHRLLFHGEDFQGITSVDGCDASGILVSARCAPNPERWIKDPLRRRWIADPSAVDCAFQALILWSFSERNAASLPVRFGRYEQFRTAFPKGGVQIAAHIDSFNDHKARATIEFLDPKDGSLVARIEDYECVIDASLNEAFQRNELAHESVGG